MILLPDLYYASVPAISIEVLTQHHVQGIAIDVDNTLIDYRKEMKADIPQWVEKVKKSGLKICILSNSNRKEKVEKVAQQLDLKYILAAKKPLKKGLYKAMEMLHLPAENIAVVGDQIFTDVWGANRMHMVSVYVEPIDKKEFWYTKWKRPFEKLVLKKYIQQQKIKQNG